MRSALNLTVIIPTHNGATTLAQCLQAIRSSSLAPLEIIVVDDASTDNSAEIATQFNCRVIRSSENVGAAHAKNAGAQSAAGEILFFTDDDVMITPDTLERIAADFGDAGVAGVVGIFNRTSPFRDFASNYKNLWMRFTYERISREKIGLFYTSVAAIRREIFLKLGGFDENYRGASIAEDTEFGQRAWGAGHNIILDPNVHVTHYKRYTLTEVFKTDFLRARALTLMRLRKLGKPFFTSVPGFYQLAVPIIFLALASLALSLVISHLSFVIAGAALLSTLYVLFFPWFAYLARERGARFALIAALIQPFDAIAVGTGMFIALVDWARGIRY